MKVQWAEVDATPPTEPCARLFDGQCIPDISESIN